MTKVALRGLAQRKLRAFVTVLAILLGVAFIAGSYVLTDTINQSFDELFDESFAGTDVAVSVEHHGAGRLPGPAARSPSAISGSCGRCPACEKAAGGIFSTRPLRRREGGPAQQQLLARVHQLRGPQAVRDAHLHGGPPAADRRRGLDRRVDGRSRGVPHRRHAPDRRPGRREGLPDHGDPAARRDLGRRVGHRSADAARGPAHHQQEGRARRHLGRGGAGRVLARR